MSSLKLKKINNEVLYNKGLIKNLNTSVKILGNGEISEKIEFSFNMFSKSAIDKIEKSGGKVIFI
mgnify:CR=1 FL=1